MKIAILGSGRIGSGLARAWAKAGHRVALGVRSPDDPTAQSSAETLGTTAMSLRDAVQDAEVVVLAVPFAAIEEVILEVGELAGQIVIDATNAVEKGMNLKFGHTTSSAEQLQLRLPRAKLVKSFNAQGAENLENPIYPAGRAANFYCGDDAEANAVVGQLVAEVGFEPVDAGPLSSARLLEPLMLLWVRCSRNLGTRELAFQLLRR